MTTITTKKRAPAAPAFTPALVLKCVRADMTSCDGFKWPTSGFVKCDDFKPTRTGATVHAPRFGAGLAGGDWTIIERLIQEYLTDGTREVTIYDLPVTR